MINTVHQLLKQQAEQIPDAIAFLAPGRDPLTYRSLYLQTVETVKSLNALGIGRNDRVAIVLPNGPEMASAFLGVAAGATSAPLNPAYRASEFDFYLGDLNAKALIVQQGADSPSREVARARGIPILEISHQPEDAAGIFRLAGNDRESAPEAAFAEPEDVALVLHTSGTTSRPKIVPLTQVNICTSACNIMATLQLTSQDRCLNVMPLFHIHGLMAAVLASLTAGASLVCTHGFQADQFFNWLCAFNPTWYSAVPTMHQSVLSLVEANPAAAQDISLRFIRSSSASLPPQVMKGLEDAFGAPVIEAYGMTEASHQMASNPLPPRPRKPGSVGIAAGPEVAIMDEAGNLLPHGQPGEIVIRGDNVTLGYENNPAANQNAFTNGWFRTGDQGVMDQDGYLSITGRLKEMVNRGGEKVAPREVDEALLDHPDVAQVVAFAKPHPTLGEDLVAAVVLRKDSTVTERDLRSFAFSRLADHKVPSQIIIVDEIPKGPTGKLQRIGLADKLGSKFSMTYEAPRDSLETSMARIWARVLGLEQVGIQDNFFTLGGDSLLAASVIAETGTLLGRELHPSILFRAPTIEQLSGLLQGESGQKESYLVPVQPGGNKVPLFFVPGHGGDVFTYVELTRRLGPDQPVYSFRFPEPARLDNKVADAMREEMAALYVNEMRSLLPEGPYLLAGFCFGGEVAMEMAQLLLAQGCKPEFLGLIFVYLQGSSYIPDARRRIGYHLNKILTLPPREKAAYMNARAKRVIEKISRRLFPRVTRQLVRQTQDNAYYYPLYYRGKITLFRPIEGGPPQSNPSLVNDRNMGWTGLADEIELHEIPGDRARIFQEPNVLVFAERLKACLDALQEKRLVGMK